MMVDVAAIRSDLKQSSDASSPQCDCGEEVATVPGSRIDWYGEGYPAGTTPDRDERAFRMLETLLR